MAVTMGLYLVACDRLFYEGRIEHITVPTADGELGIWPNHEELFIAISMGELRFVKEDGEQVDVFVTEGFAEVANNRMKIMVQTIEKPEEIDINRAKEAEERAKEALRQKRSIQEYHQTKASLARAMERMKQASRHSH
ncbi:MAG: ATP synthase F1 subunit epsilon [Eubacterium sp.]|nr:ATP synthase F1 subunit epsilon [Eubacterium sp.]